MHPTILSIDLWLVDYKPATTIAENKRAIDYATLFIAYNFWGAKPLKMYQIGDYGKPGEKWVIPDGDRAIDFVLLKRGIQLLVSAYSGAHQHKTGVNKGGRPTNFQREQSTAMEAGRYAEFSERIQPFVNSYPDWKATPIRIRELVLKLLDERKPPSYDPPVRNVKR